MDAPATVTAHELGVARHLVRRAVLVAPLVVVGCGLLRGPAGAVAAAVGLALVAGNFAASAHLIAWAAPRSLTLLQVVVLGGFVARLAVITGVVVALARTGWTDVPVLVLTVAVTHLVLLAAETRSVGLSLGAPGLRPGPVTAGPSSAAAGPTPLTTPEGAQR